LVAKKTLDLMFKFGIHARLRKRNTGMCSGSNRDSSLALRAIYIRLQVFL